MKPRLVDAFSGAGGAAKGYQRAGFYVVGIDIAPQPHYCGDEFIQGDALEMLADLDWLAGFDAIHASPPCQAYSVSTSGYRSMGKTYPDLLATTRDLLAGTGLPWVIENVPGAPMRIDYRLCGCMFGLPKLRRERWFETSWHGFDMRQPCYHPEPAVTVIGHGPNQHSAYKHLPGAEWTEMTRQAMGIDWMNREELGQAIPPAYTEYIGRQLLASSTWAV